MVAVGVGRHAVRGQVVESRGTRVAVASPAGFGGNVGGKHGRSRVTRREDEVFAVARGTVWRVLGAGRDSLAVNAFFKGPGDFFVARAACGSHIPMADSGLRISRRQNSVAPVAIGASCGVFSRQYRAPVHALQVLLYGMRDGNFVPR